MPHLPRLPRIPSRRATRRLSYAIEEERLSRTPPPRTATRDTTTPHAARIDAWRRPYAATACQLLTQLPAIRRCHMPRVSVHGAGHTPRPHAHPHRASHSYPRYHGATCRTYRCMTQATRRDRTHTSPPRPAQLPAIRRCHMPRPHDRTHLPTTLHTATRDTTVPHAARIGA